jgi:AcrR family transcriptional regulator
MSNRDPKQIILDVALAIFAEFGFEGATTAQILARTGMSNGALFHHFPTKEAIAEAIYLRGIGSYQEGLVETLKQHRGAKVARSAVKAAVRHHLAWVESNRDLARFMYERGRPDWQPTHGMAVRKLNRDTARHVHDWMTPLVEAGVIRDLPITVLAAFINGPAHFIARRWLSGLITARPSSFADVLADAAWAAIAPYKARPSSWPPPRISPAALIESAALDAARSATGVSASGDWAVASLTMIGSSKPAAVSAESARVESLRLDGEGRIAMIDALLLDVDGNVTARGYVICSWRDNPIEPNADANDGSRRQNAK